MASFMARAWLLRGAWAFDRVVDRLSRFRPSPMSF